MISNKLLAGVSAFIATTSFAGWASSGGDYFSTAKNPWYLSNTSKVSYCIAADEENFGETTGNVRVQIKKAFQYWKEQFEQAEKDSDAVELATQKFVETECDEYTDITFQLGILSPKQKRFLQHPEFSVARTVRTSYDEVNLRGKGFVYVSPETGPLALKALDRENTPILNRWSHAEGKLLEIVLIHEIGHIFGLQHAEGVMSEDVPRGIISSFIAVGVYPKMPIPDSFIRKDETVDLQAWLHPVLRQGQFGSNQSTEYIKLHADKRSNKYELHGRDSLHAQAYKLGELVRNNYSTALHKDLITIYLPEEQKVMDRKTRSGPEIVVNTYEVEKTETLSFKSQSGEDDLKHLVLVTKPSIATLHGMNQEGEMQVDLGVFSGFQLDFTKISGPQIYMEGPLIDNIDRFESLPIESIKPILKPSSM